MAQDDGVQRVDYDKLHQKQKALYNVQQALKADDKDVLDRCVEECKELKIDRKNPTFLKGDRTLKLIFALKAELDDARRSNNAQKLENTISRVKCSGVERFLQDNLEKAKYALEKVKGPSSPRFRRPTIGLTNQAMSEIRKYQNPSPLVHRIMSATLLLLGENEEKTQKWTYVQSMCFPATLNRRILDFNENQLDQTIAERAEHLLSGMSLSKVRRKCPGIACFYVWSRKIAGGESDNEEDEDDREEAEIRKEEKKLRDLLMTVSEADKARAEDQIKQRNKNLQMRSKQSQDEEYELRDLRLRAREADRAKALDELKQRKMELHWKRVQKQKQERKLFKQAVAYQKKVFGDTLVKPEPVRKTSYGSSEFDAEVE